MSRKAKENASPVHGCSRREFLGGSAAVAGMSVMGVMGVARADEETQPLRIPPGTPPARVARVHSSHVVRSSRIQQGVVAEMLEEALKAVSGKTSGAEAWRALLKPEDMIGIKFNRSGQAALAGTPAMADALLKSLVDAGWAPRQIVCIEPPPGIEERYGTARAVLGYDEEPTDFGSGSDQLASVLRQITALINVPFLKTHNIARMTACLKNLSHGLIKHPARYHGNGCHPHIADIVSLDPIRQKLRLNLVDAIRVVFDRGPEPEADNTLVAGTVLAAGDAVAADALGLMTLNEKRRLKGLPPVNKLAMGQGGLPYLARAHRIGLGIAIPSGIEVLRRSL
jgi:hypothetical protein